MDHITLLVLLKSSKRDNINVISLILCEMHFNNFFKRRLEYMAWFLLSLIKSKRILTLSVGIAQVQIKHWIEHGFIRRSFNDLKLFTCPLSNYDIVNKIIKHNVYLDRSKLIAKFRGETRLYHLMLFEAIENKLNNLKLSEV